MLAEILQRYDAPHLVLIATMRQILAFAPLSPWAFSFDFVLDGVMPKQSKSRQQPNYTHQTGAYFKKPEAKSAFDRYSRQRSDTFSAEPGYWPTIFHAPRQNVKAHGLAKNQAVITDILGSFTVRSVIDPFAGSGTTGMAAYDLGLDCLMIEKDSAHVATIKKLLRFVGFGATA